MNSPYSAYSDEPTGSFAYPLLYNTVYCSRATAGVDAAVVDSIIKSSHRNNPEYGITGLLVFGSGIFFQWLEGPRDNVISLMERLKTDPRHENVVLLTESEEVRERLFPDWAMELVTTTDIRDVLQDALDTASDEKNAAVLKDLLARLNAGGIGSMGSLDEK